MQVRLPAGFDHIECAIIAILTRTRQLSTQLLVFEVAAPFTQPNAKIYANVRSAAERLEQKGVLRRIRTGEWMLAESDGDAESDAKDRLAAILGMLGSAHEGEILAAAKAAETERRRLGATWQELLAVAEPELRKRAA